MVSILHEMNPGLSRAGELPENATCSEWVGTQLNLVEAARMLYSITCDMASRTHLSQAHAPSAAHVQDIRGPGRALLHHLHSSGLTAFLTMLYQKLLYTFCMLLSSSLTLKVVYALNCARNSGDGSSGQGTAAVSWGRRSPM